MVLEAETAESKAAKTKAKLKKQGAIGALILGMIYGTINIEDGYVNDKDDPGGETNMGATKTVARAYGYTGPMKTLPKDVAVSIYYDGYIVKPGFEPLVQVNAPVVEELFDTGVNMGPVWPSRWFQETINETCGTKLVVDGNVGAGTVNAFTECQSKIGAQKICVTFLDKLDAKQKARYLYLIDRNPVLVKYKRGWLNTRIGNVPRQHCEVKYGA